MFIKVVYFKLLFFISFWHLKIVCEMKKKKILAKSSRCKKTIRGRYQRSRRFYFNLHYFFLIIMIFCYFYEAPQISVRNCKKKKSRKTPVTSKNIERSLAQFQIYFILPDLTGKSEKTVKTPGISFRTGNFFILLQNLLFSLL